MKKNIVFWNVDTQNDFMKIDGSLPVPDAHKIGDNLQLLTNLAKKLGIKVVNTADWHNEHSVELSDAPDFVKTFPKHCMMNTSGAEFVPETKPENPYVIDWQDNDFDEKPVRENRNLLLYKDDFDIFKGNKHTDKVLEIIKPDFVIVYGVATNVCVNYAVLGLRERKIKTFVISDAVKELPGCSLDELFSTWTGKGAADIKTSVIEPLIGFVNR